MEKKNTTIIDLVKVLLDNSKPDINSKIDKFPDTNTDSIALKKNLNGDDSSNNDDFQQILHEFQKLQKKESTKIDINLQSVINKLIDVKKEEVTPLEVKKEEITPLEVKKEEVTPLEVKKKRVKRVKQEVDFDEVLTALHKPQEKGKRFKSDESKLRKFKIEDNVKKYIIEMEKKLPTAVKKIKEPVTKEVKREQAKALKDKVDADFQKFFSEFHPFKSVRTKFTPKTAVKKEIIIEPSFDKYLHELQKLDVDEIKATTFLLKTKSQEIKPKEIKSKKVKSPEGKPKEIKSKKVKSPEGKPKEIKPKEIKPKKVKSPEGKPKEIKQFTPTNSIRPPLRTRKEKNEYYRNLYLQKKKQEKEAKVVIAPVAPTLTIIDPITFPLEEAAKGSIINQKALQKKIIYSNKKKLALYDIQKLEYQHKLKKNKKKQNLIDATIFNFYKKKNKKKRYNKNQLKKVTKQGLLISLFMVLKLKSYMNMLAHNISSTYNFNAKKLKIFFYQLHDMNVGAAYLARYIALKLLQKYPLAFIMKNVLNFFIQKRFTKNIIGFKVCCSGRVSRKQRATYYWKSYGFLGISSVTTKLDYFFCTIPLKFGAAGVKVWLLKGKTLNFHL